MTPGSVSRQLRAEPKPAARRLRRVTRLHGATRAAFLLLGLVCAAQPAAAQDDTQYRLKLSDYSPPTHHQHGVIFTNWANELAERSNGRLVVDLYPSQQLGKLSQQYNLARRGDVDIAFVLHGIPAGRFPLTELAHLPMLFRSSEQSAQVLMDLVPDYLAAEHRGVKILYMFGHAPGSIYTVTRPVRRPEDLRGLRIRHPSSVIGETLRIWGASPAGMPVGEIASNLDKGVIDGLVMPYDGIFGFRLAPFVSYATEVFSYIATFAVVMNEQSYADLPSDLQRLIDDTTGKRAAREVGAAWDAVEVPGREFTLASGVEIISLSEAERAVFAEAAAPLVERRIAAAEAMGLPAREYIARLRELAEQY